MCQCKASNNHNLATFNNNNNKEQHHPRAAELLSELSPKELELAARTDYRYLTQPANNDRQAAALIMADRYLTSKSSYNRALQSLQATLQFRANRNLDATIRSMDVLDDKDHSSSSTLRETLSNGHAYVSGRDQCGRSTLIFVPCLVQDHEGSVNSLLWTLERAIACSKNRNAEINAIVDFSGFELWKHTPPISVGKRILTLLRNHYVGHVHRIFFYNAPTSVNYLWKTFQAFAGKKTKEKIVFLNRSSDEEETSLEQLYQSDQLPSSVMATGVRHEFDAKTYFGVKYDGL